MTSKASKDYRDGVRTTRATTYAEEEEAIFDNGYGDEKFSEGNKYKHEEIPDNDTYLTPRNV